MADGARRGLELCHGLSDLTDAWLASLVGEEPGVALVAVGGYGRRELCPGSDLDLVLVHAGRADVADVAQRLWYPVWDAGVGLDHSVRTANEAIAVADANLEAALGLLDARLVAGEPSLVTDLGERVARQWRKRGTRWSEQLAEAVRQRHGRAGEVAFLLEPDLKEGRGGLRDVHALRALAAAVPVVPDEGELLGPAADVLLGARVELQRHTGKAGNRLLLQEQDAVAEALGHENADRLMAAVSGAARTVAWVSDDVWRRVEAWRSGPRGRAAGRDRGLAPGVVLREGEVHLGPDADPSGDRALVLRVAAAAAQAGATIARAALDRLASDAVGPGGPDGTATWPDEARHALLLLLGAGPAALPVLEALDQRGLLVRVLPEWAPVRSRPQRNAYHRFTVDRHLNEAMSEAAALTRAVDRPDLLLVGTWLHDLGKGYTERSGTQPAVDHTDAGIKLMARIGPRLGFSPADVRVLTDLVRHHLLLPDTATRRDLSDPATVSLVAAAVGDRSTLDLLAALTEADSKATGDTAWTPWKAQLVRELVGAVGDALRGKEPTAANGFPRPEHRRLLAEAGGGLLVDVDEPLVTVVAPDKPGLFCAIAGTLTLHGLDVLAADVWSCPDGMALDQLRIEPVFGRAVDWPRFRAELEQAIAGDLPLDARLSERARTYTSRLTRALAPPEPRVLVDEAASERATVVEVRAPDAVGLLWRITRVLAELGLDVRHAKVQTLGPEVVDTFYVTGDPGSLAAVEEAVLGELGRTTA